MSYAGSMPKEGDRWGELWRAALEGDPEARRQVSRPVAVAAALAGEVPDGTEAAPNPDADGCLAVPTTRAAVRAIWRWRTGTSAADYRARWEDREIAQRERAKRSAVIDCLILDSGCRPPIKRGT